MFKKSIIFFGILFITFSAIFVIDSSINIASAADTASNFHVNILDEISDTFKNTASTWAEKLKDYALTLFWILATISLSWTAIELALKHAEFGEIIGELAKYIIFTGLFAFLLDKGPNIANSIFQTFAKLGGIGAGLATGGSGLPSMTPSAIVDIGLDFYSRMWDSLEWDFDTIASDLIQTLLALVFFIFCLIIAIKVLVQLIALWCYMYAGAFLLGFGGGRWTRDIAINYFKGVLSASVKYFAMLFIVAIMNTLMATLLKDMSITEPIATLQALVLPIMFFMIMETVPDMIAGIVSGKFDFTSGPAASAVAGAMAGGVTGAATSTVMAAQGTAAVAKGASRTIDYMSKHSVSEGMKDLSNAISQSSAGQAVKAGAKNAGQIGQAAANITKGAAKGAAKGISAASGFGAMAAIEPLQTAHAVLQKGASGTKSKLVAGYNAIKDSGVKVLKNGMTQAKATVSENITQPFKAGVNAAKPDTNKLNNSNNNSNQNQKV